MRLLTRSDFDGLASAVLLVDAGVVDSNKFVHPKDIQDGIIDVDENDVLANVPFTPGCGLWFDHHFSEMERLELLERHQFRGESRPAPSCARVIYDYYGGSERFSRFDDSGLMAAVDKWDSGRLTREDILRPGGWMLLAYIMDPRTGLGRYKDYRISNYQLMEEMIQYCRVKSVDEILGEPDVKERARRYFEHEAGYEEMIRTFSRVDGNVLIIDLHGTDPILCGNRFKEYVLFPDVTVSARVIWGVQKRNMVITVGRNILKPSATTDIGSMLLRYGGGGHETAGTCQVPVSDWERILEEITATLKADHEARIDAPEEVLRG